MEDTGFDLLCEGLPPNEAKMLRKLNAEWSDGDEDSFLVQFALLTRAQWRAAATVPRSITDSRKWLEQHLAEYRRQTAADAKSFACALESRSRELRQALESVAETHAKGVQEATALLHKETVVTQYVARDVRDQAQAGLADWKRAVEQLAKERHDLETICRALVQQMDWWTVKTLLLVAAIGVTGGVMIGHFWWKQ